MKKYSISVAICTYNGEQFIESQLESICSQNYPVDEIVICDDGSTDKTVQKANDFLKEHFQEYRIIENQQNLGFRKNFEKAIGITQGEIIFLCDQDDVWKKDKVEKMVEAFQVNNKCLMVFSDAELVDEKLNIKPMSLWKSIYFDKHAKTLNWWELLLKGYYVTGATMAVKRELYVRAYPFPESWYHDGWLAINAAIYGEIAALPDKLIFYRQHTSNQVGTETDIKDRLKKKKETLESDIQDQINLHKVAESRMQTLIDYKKGDISDIEFEKAKSAMLFHQSLAFLMKQRKSVRIKTIMSSALRGKYNRYYKKSLGIMMGDFWWFVVKN